MLKSDCQLFSRLFISCQTRECDLQEFLQHENQSTPAARSDYRQLHSCQKSQLMEIFENGVTQPESVPVADTIIIDGSALVNALPPRTSKTFNEYAREDVVKQIEVYGTKYQRVDVVFDVYQPNSLKSETRSKRGKGMRRKVKGSVEAPTNWQCFFKK